MIKEIHNLNDVNRFTKELIAEGITIHPDDDFRLYINLENGIPTYTKQEADKRNQLMKQCFSVCDNNGADIYSLMAEAYLRETNLDKFIPKPSELNSQLTD
jgi:hypothetical protein